MMVSCKSLPHLHHSRSALVRELQGVGCLRGPGERKVGESAGDQAEGGRSGDLRPWRHESYRALVAVAPWPCLFALHAAASALIPPGSQHSRETVENVVSLCHRQS